MVIFAMQNLLGLNRSHLFIFGFISFALGNRSSPPKKKLLQFSNHGRCDCPPDFRAAHQWRSWLGPQGVELMSAFWWTALVLVGSQFSACALVSGPSPRTTGQENWMSQRRSQPTGGGWGQIPELIKLQGKLQNGTFQYQCPRGRLGS